MDHRLEADATLLQQADRGTYAMQRNDVTVPLTIFAAVLGMYAVTAIFYPMAYIWATYEDLFGEWTQFWLFVVTLIFSVRLLFTKTRYRRTFALLAMCCLYVAMEEISWGQRLFDYSSPAFFKEHNLQGETNVHNFLTGPFSTTLKAALTYVLVAGLATYGILYPVLLRFRWRIAVWFDARGLASPPLAVCPFFAGAALFEAGPFRFNEAEVAEVMVGFAVAIMAVHYAFACKRKLPPLDTSTWDSEARSRLAVRLIVTTFLVVSIAANTTLAIYATPRGKERIDNRIENGIEKFAGRYEKHGQFETAVGLMRRLHEMHPKSRSKLRKLSNVLRKAGHDEAAAEYLNKALDIDLTNLEKDPLAASVHQSLVRTYRLLGDSVHADEHLEQALEIGLTRVGAYPDSANAAYSLGRTYELMGDNDEALKRFERANKLRPTSKKFKQAYLRAKLRK